MLMYVEPNLPYTLRAQLARDVDHARMCGFELVGNLMLTDADGERTVLSLRDGRWMELLEVKTDGEP